MALSAVAHGVTHSDSAEMFAFAEVMQHEAGK